jgi:hypothetical protein
MGGVDDLQDEDGMDTILLTVAYNALVENCIYQQDEDTCAEGVRVAHALAERLGLNEEISAALADAFGN